MKLRSQNVVQLSLCGANLKIVKTVLSCVDGSVYARFFSTDVDRYGERSCVRPVGAVYIIPLALMKSAYRVPNQTNEL